MTRLYTARLLRRGAAGVVEERLPAESADALRAELDARGEVVLGIRAETRSLWAVTAAERPLDVAWWCRELQTLLRAGMSPVEAIETLAAGTGEGARARVHAQLVQALHQGAALSRAMRQTGAFPEVLLAGVTASERTSTLADALADFLRYDELVQRLRRQVVSAALYPALVVGVGSVIAGFLLLYVIPRFSRMYGSFRVGEMSGGTAFVLRMSEVLREHGAVLAVLAVALLVALLVAWRSGRLLPLLLRALEALPVVQPALRDWRRAQAYQAMALLVRGGYTVDEALQVAGQMALGPTMAQAVERARQLVAVGKPVSAALSSADLTDAVAERLLAVGERSGNFAAILQTISERHATAFATFVERATRLLEPVLLLAVALVVGSLVLMMYMPIFDIAGNVGM